MLFVGLLKVKPIAPPMAEGIARRAQYQLPPGSRLVAEYWLQTNEPAVIIVFEADSVAPIMAIRAVWGDIFDIIVVPALTLQEGLAAAQAMAPQ